MIKKDATIGNIEWLVSCVPSGDRCFDRVKNEHCRRAWYNVRVYGRWYPQYCSTYGFELKAGKKCQMCIDVCNLEK